MLQDDDFDDVDGLVGSCGMSFQIDAWERIKKSYKELAQQTTNSVSAEICPCWNGITGHCNSNGKLRTQRNPLGEIRS